MRIPRERVKEEVLLIDDILYYRRTIRVALHALFDFGRQEKIELCVFDRSLLHPTIIDTA